MDAAQHREHLYDLLEEFAVAMVATHGIDGTMIARPMAIARIERGGGMYFATAIESTKVDEILADPHVSVIVQSPTRYACVRGVAQISMDRALVHALWQEPWRSFFPGGKDDPSIAVVIVQPQKAEYWDEAGSAGLSLVLEAAKAYLLGRFPVEREEHAEVDLVSGEVSSRV